MAGLVPATHADQHKLRIKQLVRRMGMDARHKAGHDEEEWLLCTF